MRSKGKSVVFPRVHADSPNTCRYASGFGQCIGRGLKIRVALCDKIGAEAMVDGVGKLSKWEGRGLKGPFVGGHTIVIMACSGVGWGSSPGNKCVMAE